MKRSQYHKRSVALIPALLQALPARAHAALPAFGGSSDGGTVFKVTTNGVLTMLASFNTPMAGGPDGFVLLVSFSASPGRKASGGELNS